MGSSQEVSKLLGIAVFPPSLPSIHCRREKENEGVNIYFFFCNGLQQNMAVPLNAFSPLLPSSGGLWEALTGVLLGVLLHLIKLVSSGLGSMDCILS